MSTNSETTQAELVGGPHDGRRLVVCDEPEVYSVLSAKYTHGVLAGVETSRYVIRRVSGAVARRPDGVVPYDWQPVQPTWEDLGIDL